MESAVANALDAKKAWLEAALEGMYRLKIKDIDGEISKDEYDEWRYTYPALDTSGHYVKVPYQELSDLLIKELDKKSKKK